jgi:hypothetical protein
MDISISDSFPFQPTAPSPTSDATSDLTDKPTDSVRLSLDAQIQLLVQQGESPSEIALDLGVAAMSVATYLGLAPLPSPPTPAPQNGPSPTSSIPAMK